jgi:RNA polymerase sigma-70 factor (ECF subfamily)
MDNRDGKAVDDDHIVRQVIGGNVDAFEIILKKYEIQVLTIVKRHVPANDVEETVQDAFIRAYKSLGNYKKKGRFKSWLSSVTTRTCYDYWRRKYRNRETPVSSLSEKHQRWLENAVSDTSDEFWRDESGRKEAREILDWTLSRLSPKDRMVIEMVYLEELSVKEAADLLGFSVANVKVRAFRARKKMHKLLFTSETTHEN